MSRRNEDFQNKVYIGNLITHRAPDKKEIEHQFSYYGPLKNVWIARNPPGFGYIELVRGGEQHCYSIDTKTIIKSHCKILYLSSFI